MYPCCRSRQFVNQSNSPWKTYCPLRRRRLTTRLRRQQQWAIRLIKGAEIAPLPTYIECQSPWCENDVVTELHCWGHRCDVYRFGEHDVALCFPSGWSTEAGMNHYMLCHTDTTDPEGQLLHSQAKVMTEVDLMSFLYDCGYWRASIQSVESLAPGLFRVQFLNVQVQQVQHTICSRAKPAWPVCTHLIGARGPYFTPTTDVAGDDCVIGLGIALYDFMKLFHVRRRHLMPRSSRTRFSRSDQGSSQDECIYVP